jgi:hypothetical protein
VASWYQAVLPWARCSARCKPAAGSACSMLQQVTSLQLLDVRAQLLASVVARMPNLGSLVLPLRDDELPLLCPLRAPLTGP